MVFKRFFDFLIYSNIYIAIAAVLFTVQAQIQLGMTPGWHPYLFLIFFATLSEYNFHKFMAVYLYKHALGENKFQWIAKNLKLFYLIVFVSIIGFALSAFFAKITVLITLLPIALLTFLYSFPVYKKENTLLRLREVPFAKIFIISFVWAATTIVIPIVHAEFKIPLQSVLLMITERFLFVFAITIPFDIRDIESDRNSGLKTLPIVFGEKNALHIAGFALILFTGITATHYFISDKPFLIYAFLFSALFTLFVLYNNTFKTKKHYYYGWLDGTMSIQALLVMLFYFLTN